MNTAFYALLLVQPITGLGDVVFHGRPFMLFVWQVPALLTPDPAIRGLFQPAHELGAKALLALIGLHAGAALFHGLVLRDGVLQRMLPSSLAARASTDRRMVANKHKVISCWALEVQGSSALLSLAASSRGDPVG
jgi:cytochrome b561